MSSPLQRVASALSIAASRHPWTVVLVAVGLSVASALAASRIQVKTAFQDTMADDDPIVRRMAYLSDNFPGAVVVQVVLEGNSPERLIAAGEALQTGFLDDKAVDDRLVSHVYLEQDLDFFLRRALVYLPEQELRLLDENLRRHRDSLLTLSADPSLLGVLRGIESLTDDAVPTGSTAVTVKTRLFADVVMSSLLAGRPAVDVGARVDPGPLRDRMDDRLRDTLKGLPLPPSDAEARRTLTAIEGALDLVADVLEQGEAIDAAAFSDRAAALLDLAPTSGANSAIPTRYQFSKDQRLLLIEVGSEMNLGKLEDIEPVLAHLYGVSDRVRREFPDVTIGFTGLPVQYVQEQEAILSNFVLVTILGFLGILAVFIVGFEQIALPSLSAVPLIMGILWTFGIQGVVDPTLNMLNLLFPVVLFGLGVDTAIHLLNGFAHRRALGDDAETAIRHMLEEMLPGLLTGSATTSVAFFALMLAHMKGLKTLGFTAGVGVIMAVLAMITVLPAIFVLADRRSPVVGMKGDGGPLARLGEAIGRQRYPILALFIGIVSVGAYFAPQVELERDALKMQPRGMPAAVLQEKLLKAFGISGEPSIFFAKNLTEAGEIVARARRARTVSEPLAITVAIPDGQDRKAPLIDAVAVSLKAGVAPRTTTPHTWNPAELEELRRRLAGVKGLLLEVSLVAPVLYSDGTVDLVGRLRDDVNRIERRLADASVPRLQLLDRYLQATVDESLGLVTDMTKNTTVRYEDLPESLRARVGGRDGATMVLVRANGYVGDEQFLEAHVAELYAIHTEVAGIVPAWREMLRQILDDMPRLLGVIGLSVVVLVFIGLRSFKGTLLSLAPLVVGVIALLGGLGATDTDFNFVSVLAMPLLLGTGIDYGVHLYERLRHDGAIGPALAHSGKALVLSSLTTMIGFGSLMLSVHRGVFGLGLVTSLGIFLCLMATLVLLPALVAIVQPELVGLALAPPAPPPPAPAATTTDQVQA